MKKTYMQPQFYVRKLQSAKILSGSGEPSVYNEQAGQGSEGLSKQGFLWTIGQDEE